MKISLVKLHIFIIFLTSLVLSINCYSQENRSNLSIQDIEDLENYERKVLKRLTGRDFSLPGQKAGLKLTVFGGGGMIIPLGAIGDTIKTGFLFNVGLYFNITNVKFFRNLMFSVSFTYISMTALSRNKIIQGASTYYSENEDGNFRMLPILIGLMYKIKIFKGFYINPEIAFGVSINKLEQPSKINADGSTGFSGSSVDFTMKGTVKIQYTFNFGLTIEAFADYFLIKESGSSGSFLSFGINAKYRF